MSYPPTISSVVTPAYGYKQVVSGTKIANDYVFIRNNRGQWAEVEYTTGVSGTGWTYQVELTSGDNKIDVTSSDTNSIPGNNPNILVSDNINLIVKIPVIHNLWNHLDEFGVMLGLPRIKGEINSLYKARLLDVYTNPANSTETGLKYGIARELGLNSSEVTVHRISDLLDSSYSSNLLNSDGNALGTKLEDFAKEIENQVPLFWGNIVCDEGRWDAVDEENSGYVFLPHQWDPTASGIPGKWQSPGIGDNDDLWIKDIVSHWNGLINAQEWYAYVHSGYFYAPNPSGLLGN